MTRRNRSLTVSDRSQQISYFDQAKRALAEAKTLREVRNIVDIAAAVREYARRARDRVLIEDATALRMDAERELGRKMAEQRDAGLTNRGGGEPTGPRSRGGSSRETNRRARMRSSDEPSTRARPPTLREQGVDNGLARRARHLASLTPEDYAHARREASAAASRRAATVPEPSQALNAPINVNQYANIVISEFDEKINALIDGRKIQSLYGMRSEFSERTRNDIERKFDALISRLKQLKQNLMTVPDNRNVVAIRRSTENGS